MEAIQVKTPAVRRRNADVDLLRIVAALYIIILHITCQGGLLGATEEGTYQYHVSGFLFIWTFSGVNIFGLISGYVGYSEEEKPIAFKSLLSLWLEVVFYDIGLTLLTLWLRPGTAEVSDLYPLFFPILNNSHWYFTSYAALLLLVPMLNSGVRHCSNRTLLQFLAAFSFFIIPVACFLDRFHFREGYTLIWLIVLYLTGAILKKTQLGAKLHPVASIVGILVMGFTAYWFYRYWGGLYIFDTFISQALAHQFIFPCHFFSAVLHLLLFSRLRIPAAIGRWISALAPGAFAVYIINTQKHVWEGYMGGRFASCADHSPLGVFARVIAVSVLFVAVSLIVDYLRRQLFRLLQRRKA